MDQWRTNLILSRAELQVGVKALSPRTLSSLREIMEQSRETIYAEAQHKKDTEHTPYGPCSFLLVSTLNGTTVISNESVAGIHKIRSQLLVELRTS
jgi:hypothetical protein